MKDANYNLIRSVACILVILLHCTGSSISRFDGFFDWNQSLLVNSFTRCCVPLFVMLSGVLLMQKEDEISTFYKKRLGRILIPFLLWAGVFFIFKYFYLEKALTTKGIVSELLNGPVYYHFWYIYMIFGLYLFLPFIMPWIKKASIKEMLIFVFVWQVFETIYTVYRVKYGLQPALDLTNFGGFIGYFITGYLMAKHASKLPVIYYVLLFFTGVLITFSVNFFMSKNSPWLMMNDYLLVSTFISSVGLFGWLLHIRFGETVKMISDTISQYSFGIYFFHVIPLRIFFDYDLFSLNGSGITGIFIYWIAALLTALGCIMIASRIPLIGKYLK